VHKTGKKETGGMLYKKPPVGFFGSWFALTAVTFMRARQGDWMLQPINPEINQPTNLSLIAKKSIERRPL
jgi:hypothetical protein